MPRPDALPAGFRITSREEAERLLSGILATMGELETVLETETAHVRVGRVRDGLAQEARKTELASAYLQGLEAVKANAIALARFAPQPLDGLKAAHGRFGRVIATNQAVLATARAISENLVKDLAQEMNRAARPQVYAPAGAAMARPARSEPLVLSRSL